MVRVVPISLPEGLFDGLAPSPAQVQFMVATIAAIARSHWIITAKKRLHSTEEEYVRSLGDVVYSEGSASITLGGKLANMVEQGHPSYDIRAAVLRSGNKGVKVSKKGFMYASIPFRHMMGGTGRVAPAIGSAGGADASKSIGAAVRSAARGLTASTERDGRMKWGARLSDSQGGEKLRARHKTGIYSGMVKVKRAYGKGSGSQYMTFRMISQNPKSLRSDEGGANWMHPGIKAHRIMDEVARYVQL